MPRHFFEDLTLGLDVDVLTLLLLPFLRLFLAACAKGKLFATECFQPFPEGPSHPTFFVVAVVLHESRMFSGHQFK